MPTHFAVVQYVLLNCAPKYVQYQLSSAIRKTPSHNNSKVVFVELPAIHPGSSEGRTNTTGLGATIDPSHEVE